MAPRILRSIVIALSLAVFSSLPSSARSFFDRAQKLHSAWVASLPTAWIGPIFAFVFGVKLQLFPLGGSTVRLRHQIPYTVAAELLLTGRRMSAAEAKAVGLIGHVVPDGQALSKARELADRIAANAPLAVQAVLQSLREGANLTEEEALARELELGWPVFATNDAREGPKAFAEKRVPRYTGT